MAILASNPQVLAMYGHNPDKILHEINEAKAERDRINNEFDSIK